MVSEEEFSDELEELFELFGVAYVFRVVRGEKRENRVKNKTKIAVLNFPLWLILLFIKNNSINAYYYIT